MTESKTLILIEDDSDLRDLFRMAAEKRGYYVSLARNGLEAKDLLEKGALPDLIVLDINMPGMDGFSFCRWLREDRPLVPVIFLSARAEEYDKILALEIGGDDYLTKPFSMKELFARIEVSLRRIKLYSKMEKISEDNDSLRSGELEIHPDNWTCTYQGEDVVLTVSEFRIILKLMRFPGQVFDRDKLARAAFPEDQYNSGRSVDIHISRLRGKLQRIDGNFDSIETVYQVGYKWKK